MPEKMSVLIVDDDHSLRRTLSDILKAKGCHCVACDNEKSVLGEVKNNAFSVALIDLKLPNSSGLEVMKKIKKCSPHTECIILTGYASQESAIQAINLGAYSYLTKPYDMKQLILTVQRADETQESKKALVQERNLLQALIDNIPDSIYFKDERGQFIRVNKAKAGHHQTTPEDMVGKTDFDFLPFQQAKKVFADDKKIIESNEALIDEIEKITQADGSEKWYSVTKLPRYSKEAQVIGTMGISHDITAQKKAEQSLQQSFIELTQTISRILAVRDPYTAGHQQRVAQLVKEVGKKLGFNEEKLLGLYIGALLHDIGKIAVPEMILNKPGHLVDTEWAIIRSHPKRGYEMLEKTHFPWPVQDMILHHHERLDGSGYPEGIKGDKLSQEVRILGVCDVVEAMSSHRPYRASRKKEEVLEEIKKGEGTKYDSKVVNIFLKMIEDGKIFQEKS